MKEAPTARQWMKAAECTLRPDDEMNEAVLVLTKRHVAAVPVVDDDDRLVGLLTEKDCLRTFCHWVYEGLRGGHVADFMSPIKATITPEMDLLSVASIFLQNYFPSLPVLDGGRLVGMIHRLTVLQGIAEWQHELEHARVSNEHAHERPSSIEEIQRVVGSHTREQIVARFKES